MVIFSKICTAHAQKRLFMFFRCKYKQRLSILRPRFPARVQNFGDLATFSVDYHWKCVPGHCACAESRDPWVGGSKPITFLESPTPICLFTIQLLLGYDDDISSTSKLIANFLVKFGKFSLLWQQGSSKQSLTDTIQLADPENPLLRASIWAVPPTQGQL